MNEAFSGYAQRPYDAQMEWTAAHAAHDDDQDAWLSGMKASEAGLGIGARMSKRDRQHLVAVLETSPDGVSTTWRNVDTGTTFAMTALAAYGTSDGVCRGFELEADWLTFHKSVAATACLGSDGRWRAVD